MYYAYLITNNVNKKVYIGITINPRERWLRHQSNVRNETSTKGKGTYLYNAMRKHGIENFSFEVVKEFEDEIECGDYEVSTISFFRKNDIPNYNLHDGGTLGHRMTPNNPKWQEWLSSLKKAKVAFKEDTEAFTTWQDKLKEKRKGRTPALGMKHTDEAKQIASEVSNAYWDTQETFIREPEKVQAILALSHREAKEQFGISTTHYYRLKKRFATNDSK
mgnify:CR=1 FL=1